MKVLGRVYALCRVARATHTRTTTDLRASATRPLADDVALVIAMTEATATDSSKQQILFVRLP